MMLLPHLKMFVVVILYFVVMSLVTIGLEKMDMLDSLLVLVLMAWFVLFPITFIVASKKIYFWRAHRTYSVSLDKIYELLGEFSVDGLAFSYENHRGSFFLSPIEFNTSFGNKNTIVKFYTRVWLNNATKTATFCDYFIENTSSSDLFDFSSSIIHQKGMISFSTSRHSSDGRSFSFSTDSIHDKLINLFVQNGWSIRGKII